MTLRSGLQLSVVLVIIGLAFWVPVMRALVGINTKLDNMERRLR